MVALGLHSIQWRHAPGRHPAVRPGAKRWDGAPPSRIMTRWIREKRMPRWGELVVLLSAAAVAAGALAFIEIADEVREKDTRRIDTMLLRALRDPQDPAVPLGPVWMHEAGRDLTALGSLSVLIVVVAAVCGYLLLARLHGVCILVLAASCGGALASTLLKAFFDRDRPSVVPHLMEVMTSSFPSGHSMLSATIYLTLGALLARTDARRRFKIYFLSVALGLTLVVGLSRLYLGVHYPTDILAGWIAGASWAILCWLVAWHLQQRGTVESETEGAAASADP